MNPKDLETVYEALAIAIDAAPENRRDMFLAKLALLLAKEIGDPETVTGHIRDALANLEK